MQVSVHRSSASRPTRRVPIVAACLAFGFVLLVTLDQADADKAAAEILPVDVIQRGKAIYMESCADCHGQRGEGTDDAYPDPLVGDDSIGQLASIVSDTMPEGEPELCEGEDAAAVAAYMHEAFYSEAARIRNRPPRFVLQRLTANQLRQSISDLYATFEGVPGQLESHGVKGLYFDASRWKKEALRFERIDPFIDFDFGKESPANSIGSKEFYILWEGGLKVDHTGLYEIVVRSSLSMTMDFGRDKRKLIDNHVQSGDKTEFRRTLYLTAGRVYPFQIEFIQRKRKTEQPPARIQLAWVPPGGVEETIPSRNLFSDWTPPAFSLQTELPPDDRSYGYERGIAVSRQWDEATTSAAIEFAQVVHEELWPGYRRKHRKAEGSDREKLQDMLGQIVARAFRGPMTDEIRQRYVVDPMKETPNDADAIKQVLLLSLKSPRFLYPDLDFEQVPARRAVNRMALVVRDSLPTTDWLIKDAEKEQVYHEGTVRAYAESLTKDPRAEAKRREFLRFWLNLNQLHDNAKNQEKFEGFDADVIAHLHRSMDWMIDDLARNKETRFADLFTLPAAYTSPVLAEFYGDSWQPKPSDVADPPAIKGHVIKVHEIKEENQKGKDGNKKKKNEDKDKEPASDNGNPDETPEPKVALPENSADFVGLIQDQPLHQTLSVGNDGRHGVLNHPFLMSGLSYFETTSPIHRGVFLIRSMLGRTLRPPNAAFSPLSPDLHPDLTTRQRVELQTSPDSCQVCHAKINALGFTLENYDPTGRYREKDNGQPVDSSGGYDTRDGQRVTLRDSAELADYLAHSDDSIRGFVNKAFQYYTKQPPAAYGADTLDRLVTKFADSDYRIHDLLLEIVTVDAMDRIRRTEELNPPVQPVSKTKSRPKDEPTSES